MSSVIRESAGEHPSAGESSTSEPFTSDPATAWKRLSVRIIWVDLIISTLSILPAAVAIVLFGVDASGQMWPLVGLAAFGVLGAIVDVVRWIFTRFRVTRSHVELATGVVMRRHRSIQRDRIRSVDVEAKLRHRIARMRVVNIGAGQQAAAGESALTLDALSAEDARVLQHQLLSRVEPAEDSCVLNEAESDAGIAGEDPGTDADTDVRRAAAPETGEPVRVFARFEPSWFIFNIFTIWAYVLALGLSWGALWLLSTVGVDLYGWVAGLADWESIGWVGTVLVGVVAAGALGTVGLGVIYFTENWNLELSRVPSRDGTMLRTRKGLFTTREINRDENRIRGAQISEPVLWRWMRASDTSVITTGLDVWSMSEPAAILPRGPLRRAREVAGAVLGDPENPFQEELSPHPLRALGRRLWWATIVVVIAGGVLSWLASTGVIPLHSLWVALALWPVCLLAAVVAYRALGHTITGRYVITRSGLLNRATTVLQRSAVSTIVIRESVLQRRLKLRTVSTMTAAGYGRYNTPDIDRQRSLHFASQAAPGLLDPFLVHQHASRSFTSGARGPSHG